MLQTDKVTLETFIMLQKFLVQMKKILVVTKISKTAVFNIDNNKKCFLSTKLAY